MRPLALSDFIETLDRWSEPGVIARRAVSEMLRQSPSAAERTLTRGKVGWVVWEEGMGGMGWRLLPVRTT